MSAVNEGFEVEDLEGLLELLGPKFCALLALTFLWNTTGFLER